MRDLLDVKLLSQPFGLVLNPDLKLENGRLIGQMYSRLENCISVLSDMKSRKSYISYGAIADELGVNRRDQEIKSIWEDELLSRVHPDDLQKKYRLEFRFFQLLNAMDATERMDYQVITSLRIRNTHGRYMLIKHRLLYISSAEDGSIWLALCLYNRIHEHAGFSIPQGVIINSKSGEVLQYNHDQLNDLLSPREEEVLQMIRNGKRSKEIADELVLSIHTVNRHRQNIFQKLNVTTAIAACRLAETLGLLP